MNALDIVIVVLLALAALGGFRRGFVLQVAGILGAVVALAVARVEYPDVRSTLQHFAPHSAWLTVIAYLIVFLVIWGAIIILARKIRLLVRVMRLGPLDRLGGAIIGVIQGLIVVELLVYLARHVPNAGMRHLTSHSALATAFLHVAPSFNHVFPHIPS